MPITAVFPTITFPHRGVEAKDVFVANQETAQDLLSGSLTSALNTFKTEANNLETNVNEKEASATASALSASNSSLSAQGSANYQGLWTSKGYTVGQTVSDSNGLRWLCKTTHVTAQVIAEGTYWTTAVPYIGAIGNIGNPILYAPLKNTVDLTIGYDSGTAIFARATSATKIDRYGYCIAVVGTPRFEKEGLLIEGASKNVVTYSQDMTTTSGTYALNVGITRGTLNNLAIDGVSTTAVQFIPASGVASYVSKSITPFATGLNTVSTFVKKIDGILDAISIYTPDTWFNETTSPNITFTLSSKTFVVSDTYTNITGYGYKELANGWFRIWLTVEVDTNVAGAIQVRNNVTTLNGTTDSFSFYGLQCESIGFPTSYIPTTTIAVDRGADVLTYVFSNNHPSFNKPYTMCADVNLLGLTHTSNRLIIGAGSSLTYGYLNVGVNGSVASNAASGNSAASTTLSSLDFRVITTSNGETVNEYIDGLKISDTGTVGTVDQYPLISSVINVGGSSSVSNVMYGHISNVRIYDFEMTAMEVALA